MATAVVAVDSGFEYLSVAQLDAMDGAALDTLAFGVIGLDPDGFADRYNLTESRLAGLRPERVLGRHFFDEVAQCMNNFMVAQRYDDEAVLDEIVPYVLTLKMRPTPVRLRLLRQPGCERRYLLIER